MSREERRAYQRMMKNQERGPALPPAAKARAERAAAKRARRQEARGGAGAFTIGFWVRSVLIAAVIGLVGFSLQWPQMPFALVVGLGVAAVVIGLLVVVRLLQRRAATGG